MLLNSFARKPNDNRQPDGYPFDLPTITLIETLEFSSPVTTFLGENSYGKSTLLEAIVYGAGCHNINQGTSASNSGVELLSAALRFPRTKAPKTRFLFRAEDPSN
ncbi:MAG: putative ATPase [Candidatus Azotimanducaceae bacterium]|jgi:predicted ATPase